MFDEWAALGDAALLASMATELRTERIATARRILAAGTLAIRRDPGPDATTALWTVDDLDVAIAEVSAHLGISRHRARTDMLLGTCLIQRLPELANRFLAGDVDRRIIATIDDRTLLIQDPDVLAAIDTKIAAAAPHWNHLSEKKLTEILDWLVTDLDPDAQRTARHRRDDTHVTIHPDRHGMADLTGRLTADAGLCLDARLTAVAATVCPADPRTHHHRRADALTALCDGHTRLDCQCGTDTCTATDRNGNGGHQIVIHVLTDHTTLDATTNTPAYMPGHGPIPADHVRELAGSPRTKVRPVPQPDDLVAEKGYRPSTGLAAFLLCRDLTCRWPGCTRPAQNCDTDHTTPWPHGATHPSNTKHLCRHHHLMKTFWIGTGGWNDTQHPDGTITFTSPTGLVYTTTPLGAMLFPHLATPTGTPPSTGPPPDQTTDRTTKGLRMPTRPRTRAQQRQRRITTERDTNIAHRLANPPPF
ncbi:HNH endonuclease signature motif containing protein [Mycolicibacterium sediminis]|uniref:DUF222 domain-containing protein n=1 Tax=Mycolicibacterium sediminis TaxID=1286180 RepID=A0A7I7QMX1_9MYCO|nr:HNH endonuclease signature motif containing protein [Mycolicibacterium sediminis]BBY27713.1 hypothetical protein MSEDJ_18090 [Mycolicibacterium sediminis]